MHKKLFTIPSAGTKETIKYKFKHLNSDIYFSYINHYLVPVVKYSYYAGVMTYKSAQNVFDLLQHCKEFLNTNGNGWLEPINDFSEFKDKIQPIELAYENIFKQQVPCVNLILNNKNTGNYEDILVDLPKLGPRDNGKLTNIWLPFKRKHNFNLNSKSSAYILMRYFVAVTYCYQFEEVDQQTFNRKLQTWLKTNIESSLYDTTFYPGLGAVLRVFETVNGTSSNKPKIRRYSENNNREKFSNFMKNSQIEETLSQIQTIDDEPTGYFKRLWPKTNSGHDTHSNYFIKDEQQFWIAISSVLAGLIFLICLSCCCIRSKFKKKKLKTEQPKKKKKFRCLKWIFCCHKEKKCSSNCLLGEIEGGK